MDFIQLLDSAHPYLSLFDYDHYPRCFAEFEANAAPFFQSLEGADLAAAADRCVELAAARWEALPRRQRAEISRKDRSVLGIFFTPAAARFSEGARAFSAVLQERWNSRFPRSRFLPGDYDAIVKGFDTDFFGITLRKTKKR